MEICSLKGWSGFFMGTGDSRPGEEVGGELAKLVALLDEWAAGGAGDEASQFRLLCMQRRQGWAVAMAGWRDQVALLEVGEAVDERVGCHVEQGRQMGEGEEDIGRLLDDAQVVGHGGIGVADVMVVGHGSSTKLVYQTETLQHKCSITGNRFVREESDIFGSWAIRWSSFPGERA